MNSFRTILTCTLVSTLFFTQTASARCQDAYHSKSDTINANTKAMFTWPHEGESAAMGTVGGIMGASVVNGSILVGAAIGLGAGAIVAPGVYWGVQKIRMHRLNRAARLLDDAELGAGINLAMLYLSISKKHPDVTVAQVIQIINTGNNADRFCEPNRRGKLKFWSYAQIKRYTIRMINAPITEETDEEVTSSLH